MGDFALGDANRNDHAAVFHGLAVDVRLVLMDIGAEQAMPQPGFFHAGRQAGSASLEAARVKHADVGFIEPSGLERLYSGLSMGGRVIYSNQSFVSHLLLPKVRLFAFVGRRVVDRLTRTLHAGNDCFLVTKRDTVMKLFCRFFPSYSHFFFQKQATLSMKNFFYDRYDRGFAFMANRRHLENLSTNRNCLNFRALSDKVFIDGDLSRVRLLADPHTTCFDSFLCQQ